MQRSFAVCVALSLLTGCAAATPTKPETPSHRMFAGICGLQPIGQNEAGIVFVLARCEEKK